MSETAIAEIVEEDSVISVAPAVMQLSRAEIAEQVATARAFPRNLKKVLARVEALATVNEDIAAGCLYSLPIGGKNIEGPSVRLAEIFVTCWGNLRVQTIAIDSDDAFVTACGMAMDLESNSAVSIQTKRRIVTKKDYKGKPKPPDNDDIQKATNIALSIAFRNATFKIVPKVFVNDMFMKVKAVALGKAESFGMTRERMLQAYAKMGIVRERVFARVGVLAEHDLTQEHVLTLRCIFGQIRDGETQLDEAFPEPKPEGKPELAGKKMDVPPAPVQAATEATKGETPKGEQPKKEVKTKEKPPTEAKDGKLFGDGGMPPH